MTAELQRRGDAPAVVCCETLDVLGLAESALERAGISYRRIDGKVSTADRAEAIEQHRQGQVRVLLASRVREHGLNLQHCALLISLDTSWNPARERQREGRICRMGSPFQTVEHVTLVPDTPHARRRLATIEQKSAAKAAVLG